MTTDLGWTEQLEALYKPTSEAERMDALLLSFMVPEETNTFGEILNFIEYRFDGVFTDKKVKEALKRIGAKRSTSAAETWYIPWLA